MRTWRITEKERRDEIKNLKKTFLQTQNTVYHKTKPNSLLKTEIKTRNSSVFSETQKSKPFPRRWWRGAAAVGSGVGRAEAVR